MRKSTAIFLDAFQAEVAQIGIGDPLESGVRMGPMIREGDAARVSEWIKEAVSDGAELLTGGEKQDQFVTPAILANVKPEMKISCDEVFRTCCRCDACQ